MKRICAWCSKELSADEKKESQGAITHGICSVCALKISDYKLRTAQEILDILKEPVFVVDAEGIIRGANRKGRQLLGKDIHAITGHPGGNVFECAYSRLPEGCGRTEHCKTCAIRNIVMDTLSTGNSYRNVPAFQSIRTPEGDRVLHFLISTEKVGNHILLRIDEAKERAQVSTPSGPECC